MRAKNKFLVAILLTIVMALVVLNTGCQYGIPIEELGEPEVVEEGGMEEITGEVTEEETGEVAEEEEIAEEVVGEEAPEEEEISEEEVEVAEIQKKIYTEGELVSFPNLAKVDPDGDTITYTFTPPLDDNGEWQTEVGDAAEYKVTITASDGKKEVSKDLILVIQPKNKAPVIKNFEDITVMEGDTVVLEPEVTDPDGDELEVEVSGWMTTETKKTGYDDAGTYKVTLTASDGITETKEEITVTVKNKNRAPLLGALDDIEVTEGDLVSVEPVAADPDGDEVKITFSEPLDDDGEWQTEEGDAGEYDVTVIASDGDLTDEEEFTITVNSLNAPPKLEKVIVKVDGKETSDIVLAEGESKTVTLDVKVSDPDGEEVTVTYSGWMKTQSKTVKYGEKGGTFVVKITATDGVNEVSQDVKITVNNAPSITI